MHTLSKDSYVPCLGEEADRGKRKGNRQQLESFLSGSFCCSGIASAGKNQLVHRCLFNASRCCVPCRSTMLGCVPCRSTMLGCVPCSSTMLSCVLCSSFMRAVCLTALLMLLVGCVPVPPMLQVAPSGQELGRANLCIHRIRQRPHAGQQHWQHSNIDSNMQGRCTDYPPGSCRSHQIQRHIPGRWLHAPHSCAGPGSGSQRS